MNSAKPISSSFSRLEPTSQQVVIVTESFTDHGKNFASTMESETHIIDDQGKAYQIKFQKRFVDVLAEFELIKQNAIQTAPKEDCVRQLFYGKMIELDALEKDVLEFENPEGHFTKIHRNLVGQCQKMQEDFDEIKIVGRDELKMSKKEASKKIQALTDYFDSQLHESGNPCKQCELQNLS